MKNAIVAMLAVVSLAACAREDLRRGECQKLPDLAQQVGPDADVNRTVCECRIGDGAEDYVTLRVCPEGYAVVAGR